jgi:hypothetical protein
MVPQGVLNRVRASVIVPQYTSLNINSSHMSQKMLTGTPEEDFTEQPMTAVGVVNAPNPYVKYTVNVGILRTQALAYAWLQQAQTTVMVGRIVIHSDTSAFPQIRIHNASIIKIDPGAYDGRDPVVDLTLRGVFYVNNDMWSFS